MSHFIAGPYRNILLAFCALLIVSMFSDVQAAEQEQSAPRTFEEIEAVVTAASKPTPPWSGPTVGAEAQTGKSIAIIAEDTRNGGILGVAQGVTEAAEVLEWKIKVFDAGGSVEGRNKAIASALESKPDGVVLIGADAAALKPQLASFATQEIPIVGWHVGSEAGVMETGPVAVNISTDPLAVARITAMAAIGDSNGKAGVVIFTDSNFEIAMTKANAMAEIIQSCDGCTLLEMSDVAISNSQETMPGVIRDLLSRHGDRWTYALAINDIYFDYAVPELIKSGKAQDNIRMLSAGDGSAAAFQRILTKRFQIGTVAEPLNLHGWQLADELNRLLAGQPADGYVLPVHLVTSDNIGFDGGTRFVFDPDNGYRDIYRQIWKP